jgi:hypothetical protein
MNAETAGGTGMVSESGQLILLLSSSMELAGLALEQ